jgi:hypothetical protein
MGTGESAMSKRTGYSKSSKTGSKKGRKKLKKKTSAIVDITKVKKKGKKIKANAVKLKKGKRKNSVNDLGKS